MLTYLQRFFQLNIVNGLHIYDALGPQIVCKIPFIFYPNNEFNRIRSNPFTIKLNGTFMEYEYDIYFHKYIYRESLLIWFF